MQHIFSSNLIKQKEYINDSLKYYLDQAIPKGSIICAIYPKKILTELLPQIAKEKHCKIINIYGTKELTRTLLKTNLLAAENQKPDLFITEPDALTPGGALVKPNELSSLQDKKLIGITTTQQWTNEKPETHDYIPLHLTITELGIHTPENLDEELNASSLV